MVHACAVFAKMLKQTVTSWNLLIGRCVKDGHVLEAFDYFKEMNQQDLKPNRVTFLTILKACTSIGALEQGRQIHAEIIKSGYELDISLGSTLIDMYSKCGKLELACQVFNKLPSRDIVSWNVMIAGYAKHGLIQEILKSFGQIEQDGLNPDKVTFVNALKAFLRSGNLDQQKQIHALIMKAGLESDIFVGSSLIHMYSKCQRIEAARNVFERMPKRNVVAWSVMIAGYAQNGHGEIALELFLQMKEEGIKPNQYTYVSALNACASIPYLEMGNKIHAQIIRNKFQSYVFVGNALIDMYAKCGNIKHAKHVFEKMSKRDVVSWNALIGGYVQHGHNGKALKIFQQMKLEGFEPDVITFINILCACTSLAAVEQGREVHAHIKRSGLEANLCIGSTLVDMYAKCGSLEEARCMFDKMPEHDAICWSSMIVGYAQHGLCNEAMKLAEHMQQEGVKLDNVTFLGILYACSHAGFLDQGCHYFEIMTQKYGIMPTAKHYACMVDLLSRAGHLEEADHLIRKIPCGPSFMLWMTLLNACRNHGNAELALCAAEHVHVLDSTKDVGPFVVLSNIYASGGMWNCKAAVRKTI